MGPNKEYKAQIEVQKYAQQQRTLINNFIQKYQPKFLTLPEARAFLQDPDFKGTI